MKKHGLRHSLPLAVSVLAVELLLPPVLAQNATPPSATSTPSPPDNGDPENSAPSVLKEVVVTAERRAQNILSVPGSVVAMSGKELNSSGIREFTDLEYLTPGLFAGEGAGYSNIYIRGVGNNINIGADPSVAVFVDDVPRLWGQLFDQLVDVERVEVLKGAQGGLYGRNATGGVIRVITLQPDTDHFEGTALLDYGEMNTFRAAGYFNLPITNTLAVSVAFERDSHDPYLRNIATNPAPYTAAMFPDGSPLGSPQQTASALNSYVRLPSGTDDQNVWAEDTKILFKPSDDFKITLAEDDNEKDDMDGDDFFQRTPVYMLGLIQNGYFAGSGIPAVLPPSLAVGTQGKFTLARAIDPIQTIRDYGESATAVLSLSDVNLTSITAYRVNNGRFFEDVNDLPIPVLDPLTISNKWFFYQEIRAESTRAGPVQLLGGATFLNDHQYNGSVFSELPPLLLDVPEAKSEDVVHNWSVYVQAVYDITRALSLTVSARQIHETNAATYLLPVEPGSASTEKKFLPSATVSYKFEDGGNAYARWARGFKTGGVNPFNPPSFFGGNLGAIFGGETVDTYEVGYRAPLFANRMALTTAVFYNKYQDLQYQASANGAHPLILDAIVNGGSARTWGAEETLSWRLIQPLTLGLNAGYLDAKYVNFQITNSTVLVPFDLSGKTMLYSPAIQISTTADLDLPLNSKLDLVGNLTISHVSSVLFAYSGVPGVLPPAEQPSYTLTDLRLGVQTADGRLEVALMANNLFDVAYTTFGASAPGEGTLGTWGAPRIIRGEVIVRF